MASSLNDTSLRWFAGVVDAPSFTKAAAELGVSRPKLSQAMLELEEARGEALFDRDAGHGALTPAGQALIGEARERRDHPELFAHEDDEELDEAEPAENALRVAFVPGVTPAKWVREWIDRHPDDRLRLIPLDHDDSAPLVHQDEADLAFVRLPADVAGLNSVLLYQELQVVVVPKDHPIVLFDQVTLAELAGENMIKAPTIADAIDLVAANVGVVLVPQSLARLHHRKDLVYRVVSDGEVSQIAIVWPADDDDTELDPRITEFFGIVRGRTARSTRGEGPGKKLKAKDRARMRKAAEPAKKGSATSAGKAASGKGSSGKASGKSGGKGAGSAKSPAKGVGRGKGFGKGRR